MSKKLVQTKFTFGLSCSNYTHKNKEESTHLKRKSSDKSGEHSMEDNKKKFRSSAEDTGNTGSHMGHSHSDGKSHTEGKDMSYAAVAGSHGGTSSQKKQKPSPHERTSNSSGHFHSNENFSVKNETEDMACPSSFPSSSNHKLSLSKGGDNDYKYKKIETDKPCAFIEGDQFFMGEDINSLKRAPECYKNVPLGPLKPNESHKIFFNIPQNGWNNKAPTPYSKGTYDQWDDDHVYMPYSIKNKFAENNADCCRWKKIKEALESNITDAFDLQIAIISYNPHYRNRWNFEAFQRYFEENEKGEEIKDEFFGSILPKMQKLALQLPELCPKAIPILKQQRNMKISFSQEQVACLLANAFFCTFPKRNFRVKNSHLPDINFSNLFSDTRSTSKLEKFSCIINYFKRVITNKPTGTVTYTRQYVVPDYDFKWSKINTKFSKLHVSISGTIEDDGRGMLQADFANKYVGGGVLGHGLVQEEIRFLICPEMILSRLFTEVLTDCEVLIMTGCERFSNYEGYSETFKFSGNHEDQTERDEWGRRYTEVVAMDALVFRGYKSQFETEKFLRELNKAYCAFKGVLSRKPLPAVCTGNWGCGAFGGDKQLKALIQMMAASAAGRDVCYFTFGDAKLCEQIGSFYSMLKSLDLDISYVFNLVKEYAYAVGSRSHSGLSLFEFITQMIGSGSITEMMGSSVDSQDVDNKPSNFRNNNDDDQDYDSLLDEGICSLDYKQDTP